ncbi:MAG: LURP-one-related family protein [Candidatus Lokiarchaeia archaeon]
MKEFLEHTTYIFETGAFKEESIIRDEDGNDLGRAVGALIFGAEVNLYDSRGKVWGTVKAKGTSTRIYFTFHDHNGILIAKTKHKILHYVINRNSLWVANPEGKKIYDVDSNWSGEKYKIKDKSGSIVAQIKQEITGLTSSDYILKIKNMNPLIALLIVPAIRMFLEHTWDNRYFP